MRLDLLYVLGSLWSGTPGPPVCSSTLTAFPSATRGSTRAPLPEAAAAVVAFTDVNVIPMDSERVLTNQTVLVEGGRITALGPANKTLLPAGAMQIDGRGKYLMPGLTDMHTHFWGKTYDETAYRLFSNLANGVTSIRYLNPISDRSRIWTHFKTGRVLGPRIYLAGSLSKVSESEFSLDSVAGYIAAYKAAGYDYILVPASSQQGPVFDSLLAAASRLGIPAASHTNGESFKGMIAFGAYRGSVEHLYAFQAVLERPEGAVSAAEIRELATTTRQAGVWITLTLDCTEQRKRPNGNIMVARQIAKALQDAGVGLLLGADADGSHGESPSVLHEELAEMVRAGLTPYQALLTGTRNVAQYFGRLEEIGTVAVGKRADLLLLDGNPLANLRYAREPAGVMIDGRWLDRATLDHGMLAFPQLWSRLELRGGIMPQISQQQTQVMKHIRRFSALADSLTLAVAEERIEQGPLYQPLLQQLADELGAIRLILTPEQREAFDPKVRGWMREHARRGFPIAVSGVAMAP